MRIAASVTSVPLVLMQHFRGSMDNWDTELLDTLAAEREVIAFNNAGVASTNGETPRSVQQMARDAIAFIEAWTCWASRSAASSPRRSRF